MTCDYDHLASADSLRLPAAYAHSRKTNDNKKYLFDYIYHIHTSHIFSQQCLPLHLQTGTGPSTTGRSPVSVSPLLNRPAADHRFINQYDPLIPPALLRHDLPVPPVASKTISASRRATSSIVRGTDPLSRLVVVVGPCSIHDVDQAKEYASRLRKGVQEGRWPGLEVVMRVYLSVDSFLTFLTTCNNHFG